MRESGGYGGFNDRYVDLRVDDHPTPIQELKRLLDLYKLYFFKTKPEDLVKIEGDVVREIQEILRRAGRYEGELTGIYHEATKKALRTLCGIENLDVTNSLASLPSINSQPYGERVRQERWREDDYIDGVVLDFLRGRFK